MSERDRQTSDERSRQFGSDARGNDGQRSGQANQWQGASDHQPGSDWQQDGGQRGGSDDYTHDYRFSGQGSGQNDAYGSGRSDTQAYGRGQGGQSSGGSYRSQLSDDDLRRDQSDAARNYERSRGGYGPRHDRGHNNRGYQQSGYQQEWQRDGNQGRGGQDRSGQRGGTGSYAGHDYDASGGNDFGNFTSEDFGGRDFSNRGGGVSGGMRSSESYRPSYGLSSWLHGDDDRDGRGGRSDYRNAGGQGSNRGSGREDYGSWRQYGESRGFLQRAGDEVASWFGDEDASRRREQDHRQDQGSGQSQSHRGRGPSNYTRSDERIREDANDHLTHDHHVDASHITVSVKDGELTLDGTVDNREAKRRAEDAVEHISGVKHVQNNLRVQNRGSSSASTSQSGTSTGSGTGATYGQSSGSGLTNQSSSSSLGGASASTTGTSGASTTGASGANTSGTTGASTTGGIGSTATAGVGGASAPRSSDKPS